MYMENDIFVSIFFIILIILLNIICCYLKISSKYKNNYVSI